MNKNTSSGQPGEGGETRHFTTWRSNGLKDQKKYYYYRKNFSAKHK